MDKDPKAHKDTDHAKHTEHTGHAHHTGHSHTEHTGYTDHAHHTGHSHTGHTHSQEDSDQETYDGDGDLEMTPEMVEEQQHFQKVKLHFIPKFLIRNLSLFE